MKSIINQLCESLQNNNAIVQATIISDSGSTPRTAGSKMLVHKDGGIDGTIGGGLVEAKVIEAAVALHADGGGLISNFDLTGSGIVESMDVVCGGELTVLLERIDPTEENRGIATRLKQILKDGERGFLVAALQQGKEHWSAPMRRCLFSGSDIVAGDWRPQDDVAQFLTSSAARLRAPILTRIGKGSYLVEPVLRTGTVFIFGAGHVSRELALFTKKIDFRTIVVDDRAEFSNQQRFPVADEVKVISDFSQAAAELKVEGLNIDDDSYIVIVTRGHSHDKTVLAQALQTDAAYIGMIGSRHKRATIYSALLKEGFTQTDLDRVHCPIGLEIAAETPSEIAVSIIAEMILVRAGK